MTLVAATPFASLFALFIAVPVSLVLGIYLSEGAMALRARRARAKPPQPVAATPRNRDRRGADAALKVG